MKYKTRLFACIDFIFIKMDYYISVYNGKQNPNFAYNFAFSPNYFSSLSISLERKLTNNQNY